MPTGYTAGVADGKITSLRDFALTCARGMGALITMRDEPWDAAIPDSLVVDTSYYDEKLQEINERIERLRAMSDEDKRTASEEDFAERMRYYNDSIQKEDEQRERYFAMIEQVRKWKTEAEGIKEFMLSQLSESMEFDCPVKFGPDPYEPRKVPPQEWWANATKQAYKDLQYYTKAKTDEETRMLERNEWLRKLKESLNA